MSYGWLTESTLVPRKPKNISVSKGSLNVLNKIIKKHIDNDNEKHENKRKVDVFELKNPGVELRNKLDKLENSSSSKFRKRRLEEKAKLYQQIESGDIQLPTNHQYLVDFERQKLENQTPDIKAVDTDQETEEAIKTDQGVSACINLEDLNNIKYVPHLSKYLIT